jgi:hypothetical protein
VSQPILDFKSTPEWTRLQLALARHIEGLGPSVGSSGRDPRILKLPDLHYIVLVAVAAADGSARPSLNQIQIKTLLREKSSSSVSACISGLVSEGYCRELSIENRLTQGLPEDARLKFYEVTLQGVEALYQYERVRLGIPEAVVRAVRPLPEYGVVSRHLADSVEQVIALRFLDLAR